MTVIEGGSGVSSFSKIIGTEMVVGSKRRLIMAEGICDEFVLLNHL